MRQIVTNYYNASNHFSAPIRREPKPYQAKPEAALPRQEIETVCTREKPAVNHDTMLITGLLLLLVYTGCDDTLLLFALLYLLVF